ncbi:MAG: 5-formyltetrahydrofolate cyclo-ligase [Candidatus Binataceae bacterium]
MADEKKKLRAILKESRGALPAGRTASMSARVQSALLQTSFYRDCRTVVLYAAVDGEVATDLILRDALVSGRKVCFARLEVCAPDSPRRSIALVAIRDASDLKPGSFGIPEPAGGLVVAAGLLNSAIVCVPGLAFTPAGARMGRGGGHYDRLLAELGPEAISVGLAYSFQVLDSIPETASDRRLHYVVTESAVHQSAAARKSPGGGHTEEVHPSV